MTRGSRPLGTPMFLESKMAKTIRRRNMVDSTWRGRKSRVQSVLSTCSPKVTPSVKILEQPGLAPRASLLRLQRMWVQFLAPAQQLTTTVTSVPGNLMPSSDLHGHCKYMVYIYKGKTHPLKINKSFKK